MESLDIKTLSDVPRYCVCNRCSNACVSNKEPCVCMYVCAWQSPANRFFFLFVVTSRCSIFTESPVLCLIHYAQHNSGCLFCLFFLFLLLLVSVAFYFIPTYEMNVCVSVSFYAVSSKVNTTFCLTFKLLASKKKRRVYIYHAHQELFVVCMCVLAVKEALYKQLRKDAVRLF